MNDLDPAPTNVANESKLAAQGLVTVQAFCRIFRNRNILGFKVFQEWSDAGETPYLDVEARSIESLCRIEELTFRAPNPKVGQKFKYFDTLRWHNFRPARRVEAMSFPICLH